jgi:beta-glucosidase
MVCHPFVVSAAPAPLSPIKHSGFPLYRERSAPINERVADLVARMTIAEKARQLDMYSGAEVIDKPAGTRAQIGAHLDETKAMSELGSVGIGSIHDLYPDAALYNEIQRWVIGHNRLGIPAIFIEEGLHGFSNSYQGGTVFPQSVNLASTFNTALALKTGAVIGAEARASGVDMILGPVLDVARDPRWGRVEEDFGEDPYLSGALGAAYVEGMQGTSLDTDHTVIAEPKHFAGHGASEGGINTSPVDAGEREVRMVLLRSFEPAVRDSHAMGIMGAYHEIDGVPCTNNPWLLTTLLRKEWGFRGFVLSDLGAIQMLYGRHHVAATPQEAVRDALSAGVDMQFYDFDHKTFQNAIIDGVKSGQLPVAVVDKAVSDVLRAKFALGLFDHPYVDVSLAPRVMRAQDSLATALTAARQSLVLLKNDGGLLPLSKSIKRIAVIGPNASTTLLGDYAQPGPGTQLIDMAEGIKQEVSAQTVVNVDDGANIDAAVATAKQAEAVILALGERQGISGEGFDRSDLNLPGQQEQLLAAVEATGVPVVLVLQNGRPLTISLAAKTVPAILEAWYPGERGGQVIAETLFGDNNPSGHLSISFPRSVGELPDYYNYDRSKVGNYIDANASPLYPFGYGLSYTSFKYSNLAAVSSGVAGPKTTVRVSVDVTNTGQRAGDDVVQLYLHPNTSSVETPDRALKGFARVSLASGETKQVTFDLSPYELEIWNAQNRWAVENGDYTVMVGGSSNDVITTSFSLKRIVRPVPSGSILLEPSDALLRGGKIRIANEIGHDLIGYWDFPQEYAFWNASVPAGKYQVTATYSCGHGPSAFDVTVGGHVLTSGTVVTTGFNDYKSVALGTVTIVKPGQYVVSVRAHDAATWAGMNIREIVFNRR